MRKNAPTPRAIVDGRVANGVHGLFLPQVRIYIDTFTERVYPQFANPEGEAEQLAENYFNEQMRRPVYDDDDLGMDAGSIAEDAQELSVDFYLRLTSMQFIVTNLFTAGLYHLVEQQIAQLLRTWSVPPGKEPLNTSEGSSDETVSVQARNRRGVVGNAAAERRGKCRQTRRGTIGDEASQELPAVL